MKLTCHEPLSTLAFKFNLRRYSKVGTNDVLYEMVIKITTLKVGRCRFTPG